MNATPQGQADITAAWLAEQMDMRIDSIEGEPIAAERGFMGQLYRTAWSSPGATCPPPVVVKLQTAYPGRQFIGQMMRSG